MHRQNDLMKRINNAYPKLSKGQKLLANYIMEHFEKSCLSYSCKVRKKNRGCQ